MKPPRPGRPFASAPGPPLARLAPPALAALALAAAGCSEVIGLGPEPSRQGSAVGGVCGLPPHPRPTCDACTTAQCCDKAQACDDGAPCLAESQCALGCAYDTACIAACGERFGTKLYEALQSCLLASCLDACLPTGACLQLIACCQRVPEGNVTRDACIGATNRDDQPGCESLLTSGLLDPFCPELAR